MLRKQSIAIAITNEHQRSVEASDSKRAGSVITTVVSAYRTKPGVMHPNIVGAGTQRIKIIWL